MDFKTVLIEDSTISNLTDQATFGVQSGASQITFQNFQAVSASNSSLVFNITVPSENIIVDRELLITASTAFSINIPAGIVPVGELAFNYGATDAFAPFPINSLFLTSQSTINNTTVSTNTQDILDTILNLNNCHDLSWYSSMTPSQPDTAYQSYIDGINTNNNPLASYNTTGLDNRLVNRGSFPANVNIFRYVAGVFTDNNPECLNVNNSWLITFNATFTEPFLALSPWSYANSKYNNQGLVGLNNLAFTLNIDSTLKRFFRCAETYNQTISAGISGIPASPNGYGGGGQSPLNVNTNNLFSSPSMLFKFLSAQSYQYEKISSKCVCPYMDMPRYLSNSNANSQVLAWSGLGTPPTVKLNSSSLQLNAVPDLIAIVVRKPMSSQTINDASSFLAINNISINFNNASGILASASQQQLWKLSSVYTNQNWLEFSGVANTASNTLGTGIGVGTIGSVLVLSPAYHFGLPSYLSSSSLGAFNLQFSIDVQNYSSDTFIPEICITTFVSGLFVASQGTCQSYLGILTKEMVLNTQKQSPESDLDKDQYETLVGGKLGNRGMASVKGMVKKGKGFGAISSGGAMVSSGGAKSKLSKYC